MKKCFKGTTLRIKTYLNSADCCCHGFWDFKSSRSISFFRVSSLEYIFRKIGQSENFWAENIGGAKLTLAVRGGFVLFLLLFVRVPLLFVSNFQPLKINFDSDSLANQSWVPCRCVSLCFLISSSSNFICSICLLRFSNSCLSNSICLLCSSNFLLCSSNSRCSSRRRCCSSSRCWLYRSSSSRLRRSSATLALRFSSSSSCLRNSSSAASNSAWRLRSSASLRLRASCSASSCFLRSSSRSRASLSSASFSHLFSSSRRFSSRRRSSSNLRSSSRLRVCSFCLRSSSSCCCCFYLVQNVPGVKRNMVPVKNSNQTCFRIFSFSVSSSSALAAEDEPTISAFLRRRSRSGLKLLRNCYVI